MYSIAGLWRVYSFKISDSWSKSSVVDPFQGICDIAVGVTAVNAGIDGFGGGT